MPVMLFLDHTLIIYDICRPPQSVIALGSLQNKTVSNKVMHSLKKKNVEKQTQIVKTSARDLLPL